MKTIKLTENNVTKLGKQPILQIPLSREYLKALSQGNLTLIAGDYNPPKPSQPLVTKVYYHLLPNLADNGKYHTQDQWIQYAKENKIGIASFSDIYNQVAKTKDKTLIELLRKAFRGRVITSDRFNYHPDKLNTTLTSHIENTIIPSTSVSLILPDWSNGECLSDILKSSKTGVPAIRKLLKTSDSKEKIAYNLEALTGRLPERTRFWTPDKSSRKSSPVRTLRLYCDSGDFHIICNYLLNCSDRAVLVSKD